MANVVLSDLFQKSYVACAAIDIAKIVSRRIERHKILTRTRFYRS